MENKALIDEAVRGRLSALYAAPDRHYHGMSHIQALLRLAHEYRALIADPEAFEAAIWFHDAIYDSRAKDNEAKSAGLARNWLAAKADEARLARIAALIEATATHTLPASGPTTSDQDLPLFLDMDLAILGAPPDMFDAYEDAVRKEYSWVPEDAWRPGRTAVLAKFLERPALFQTDVFRDRLEVLAQDNIARSMRRLARP